MEIYLPEALEQFVDDQVKSGRFMTKDQVVKEALERFQQTTTPVRPSLLGLFADEPDLMDEVVEAAMKARETRPLRLPTDG